MTTLPSRQSPGGVVVIGIDRIDRLAVDPNSTAYSLSFGAILLGRVAGLVKSPMLPVRAAARTLGG